MYDEFYWCLAFYEDKKNTIINSNDVGVNSSLKYKKK